MEESLSVVENVELEITEEDVTKTKIVFEEISKRSKDCSTLVGALAEKIKRKEISTEKGISFLEMKNHLMVQYLLGLGGVVLTKVLGKSLKQNSFIDQLIELRVVLEKIKPIDYKLKYQIEKLVRNASEKKGDDPLSHKANLDNLSDDSEIEEDNAGSSVEKKNVYCPPKIAAQPYDDDEETPAKQLEKVRKKSMNRALIRELQEEFLETPTEIFNKGDGFSGQVFSRRAEDKQRYEETYMTRLPETKKDKHAAKAISTMGVLGDEITNFQSRRTSDGKKKTLKRKTGSKGGNKSKKRFRQK